MKVKLVKTTTETVEVDVEFPIYREQDLDDQYNTVIYSKVSQCDDGKLKCVTISPRCDENIEIEVEYNYQLNASDFSLGLNQYKSNSYSFNKQLEEFNQLLYKD